ncbi:uncharacterized protein BT62DRAFT_902080 [Guyanagaster necrorhizus]|uniref:Uncharacterized protein n=1 Tax=Guyanagaster necrorhizus TaxID=856835 RepID=A0A9P7VNJ2_9AGAR|nr:uncharacterized protein BT62DRAFT_902080 [Guyanagaster necrorhizus MCA 3950]KAG7443813.1 hypothetical protein BT62DRAFT_902080 [Guyanagaster necrorhizus MCA 3950]
MSVGTPTSLGELASTSLDKDEFIPKESPKRRHALPAEQKEGWVPTRQRVDRAESSILGNALDVGQKVLMLGEVFLEFAPVPVLEDIAGMLLQIWDTLQLMNRLQCLRLTERCANILLSIRQEIHEAGDMVSTELTLPMSKLALAFSRVRVLLENLISFSSLKAHVKRKQILKQMAACNSRLQDAMGMFNISIQIRTLKHLQESNEERKKEAEVIIESLRRYNALQPTGIREEETTPKPPGLLGLPSTGSRTSLNTGPFKSPLSRSLSSTSEYHSRSTPLLPASS